MSLTRRSWPSGHRILADNVWPAECPQLQTVGMAYFAAVTALAHRLTPACAVGLGLNADFFESFTTRSTDTLRCNWYQRAEGAPEPEPGQQRMGAHTDYGIITVLLADSVPGLQIVGPAFVCVLPRRRLGRRGRVPADLLLRRPSAPLRAGSGARSLVEQAGGWADQPAGRGHRPHRRPTGRRPGLIPRPLVARRLEPVGGGRSNRAPLPTYQVAKRAR